LSDAVRVGEYAVIAVGNSILCDEGAGVHLANRMQARWHFAPRVDFYVAGTSGLQVADIMAGYQSVILLDTIVSSLPPGTVVRIDKEQLMQTTSSRGLAGHALGLKKAIEFAAAMGSVPARLALVAIVPAVIGFCEHLSRPLEAALEDYEMATLRLMQTLGISATAQFCEDQQWCRMTCSIQSTW
jgi:hydrogenase maturation protease